MGLLAMQARAWGGRTVAGHILSKTKYAQAESNSFFVVSGSEANTVFLCLLRIPWSNYPIAPFWMPSYIGSIECIHEQVFILVLIYQIISVNIQTKLPLHFKVGDWTLTFGHHLGCPACQPWLNCPSMPCMQL